MTKIVKIMITCEDKREILRRKGVQSSVQLPYCDSRIDSKTSNIVRKHHQQAEDWIKVRKHISISKLKIG